MQQDVERALTRERDAQDVAVRTMRVLGRVWVARLQRGDVPRQQYHDLPYYLVPFDVWPSVAYVLLGRWPDEVPATPVRWQGADVLHSPPDGDAQSWQPVEDWRVTAADIAVLAATTPVPVGMARPASLLDHAREDWPCP
jgi:hypothetical protein